jgi:hypothetical protein
MLVGHGNLANTVGFERTGVLIPGHLNRKMSPNSLNRKLKSSTLFFLRRKTGALLIALEKGGKL